LRHGDGTGVDLEVRYRDESVTLTARNGIGPGESGAAVGAASGARVVGAVPGARTTGRGLAGRNTVPDGAGHGLAGIRTRTGMFDGSVSYGPDETGRRWQTTVTVSTADSPSMGEIQ